MNKITLSMLALAIFMIACTPGDNVMCTQDALMCPDGSFVGREGPNCEFAECPDTGEGILSCAAITCPVGNDCIDGLGCVPSSEEINFVVCNSDFQDDDWAAKFGAVCVDSCPEGTDAYAAQIGTRCVTHISESDIEDWPLCGKSTDCGDNVCGLASLTTRSEEVTPRFRCISAEYETFIIHSGLTYLDDQGREVTVIS